MGTKAKAPAASPAPAATTTAAAPEVHSAPIQEAVNAATVPAVIQKDLGERGPTPATAPSEGVAPLMAFSPAEIDIIKHTYMPGASDDELSVFVKVCLLRQLNPFTRQIYPIKRRQKRGGGWVDVWQHQTSIDGFRLVAKRTGRYRGQTTPLFTGQDGVWVEAWLHSFPPAACKVGVHHADFDAPIFAVALWVEYVQTFDDGNPMAMWAKMPTVMLSKVAEALALRKAFPEELSGLYTTDEMAQADSAESREARLEAAREQGAGTSNGNGAGSGQAPKPKAPDPYAIFATIDPTDGVPLDIAKKCPLVGGKESWGGNGGKPLADVGTGHLERAYAWFGTKLEESDALPEGAQGKLDEGKLHRFYVMRAAIPAVLQDRKDNPDGELPLAAAPANAAAGASETPGGSAPSDTAPGTTSAPTEAGPGVDEVPPLRAALRERMDNASMPAPSRQYFQARLLDGKLNSALALRVALGMADTCLAIGDRLVRVTDARHRKEILTLLEGHPTYKPDVLERILTNLTTHTR